MIHPLQKLFRMLYCMFFFERFCPQVFSMDGDIAPLRKVLRHDAEGAWRTRQRKVFKVKVISQSSRSNGETISEVEHCESFAFLTEAKFATLRTSTRHKSLWTNARALGKHFPQDLCGRIGELTEWNNMIKILHMLSLPSWLHTRLNSALRPCHRLSRCRPQTIIDLSDTSKFYSKNFIYQKSSISYSCMLSRMCLVGWLPFSFRHHVVDGTRVGKYTVFFPCISKSTATALG